MIHTLSISFPATETAAMTYRSSLLPSIVLVTVNLLYYQWVIQSVRSYYNLFCIHYVCAFLQNAVMENIEEIETTVTFTSTGIPHFWMSFVVYRLQYLMLLEFILFYTRSQTFVQDIKLGSTMLQYTLLKVKYFTI
jgi:hypothetical protein